MRPRTVTVRSDETGNTFEIRADMVDAYPSLTVVTDEEVAVEGYEARTVAELRNEIANRNASRTDEDHRIPASGTKAELVAALVADDNPAMQADTE